MKLSYSGKVDFNDNEYWTSTEYEGDSTLAWIEYFKFGYREHEYFGQSYYKKFYGREVRPARIFKPASEAIKED